MLTPRKFPMGIKEQLGVEVGEVPDVASIGDANPANPRGIFTPQGPENLLMQLRASFPFVPIMPFGTPVTKVLTTANQAYDFELPDNTALVLFSANSDWWLSFDQRATIPTAGNENAGRVLFRPEYAWFFITRKMLSIISPNAGTIVQAMCYQPTKIPSY